MISPQPSRIIEKTIAVLSFAVAAALAFVSMLVSPTNEIAANNLLAIAQFLTLCATILGINYKFTQISDIYDNTKKSPQSVEN